MTNFVDSLTAKISVNVEEVDILTEWDIWSRHGTLIWRAKYFDGRPVFNAVYNWRDLYSYSLLALIVAKGSLTINKDALDDIKAPKFLNLSAEKNIDSEIRRIGGEYEINQSITDVAELAQKVASALKSYIADIESKNVGYANYIMCGGKDSLNLLLLPWENKTVALSAEPNFPLVKKFVEDNNLPYDVVLLEDEEDEEELRCEILENCCRMDMMHWRWGTSLKKISAKYDGKLIFWKGQMADLYMTDKWKTYMFPELKWRMYAQKIYKRLSAFIPNPICRVIDRNLQKTAMHAAWHRGAVMQGAHVAFIRAIADCLVLSAYHGPEMIKVWSELDLHSVSQKDMRDKVGELLFGGPVKYPEENPAPEPSLFRMGMGKPELFISTLKNAGFPVN